jgi:hypothetical protein
MPTREPTPTATSTPFSLIDETPMQAEPPVGFPVNPPDYAPDAAGPVMPESVQELARVEYYRALEIQKRLEGGDFISTEEEYYTLLDEFKSQKGYEVVQVWNGEFGDRYQMVTTLSRIGRGGKEEIRWFYSLPGGALSFRPDGLPQGADPKRPNAVWVPLPSGTFADWRWGEDGNIYLFAVEEETREPLAWYSPTQANALTRERVEAGWETYGSGIRIASDGTIWYWSEQSNSFERLRPPQEAIEKLAFGEVESEVVADSETGRILFKVYLKDYDNPDGLIIGEYRDGEWKPTSFEFTRTPQGMAEALSLRSVYFETGGDYRDIDGDDITIASLKGQFGGMKLEVDEQTGETTLTTLLVHRGGRVIKVKPTEIGVSYRINGDPNPVLYPRSRLSVAQIAELLFFAERHIPYGDVRYYQIGYIIRGDAPEETCTGYYSRFFLTFEDYCRRQINNPDRLVKSAGDYQRLVSKYGRYIDMEAARAGIVDWWSETQIPVFPSFPEHPGSVFIWSVFGES